MKHFLSRLPTLVAAAALISGVVSPVAHAQSSVRIDDITVASFTVLDGHAVGVVSGAASTTQPVNLFSSADPSGPFGSRRSPYRFGSGAFRFQMEGTLNRMMEINRPWFFVSASNDGSHLPSPRVQYLRPIVLPEPAITSATSSEHTVLLTGTALRAARVQLKLRGEQHTLMASSVDGSWSYRFNNVPQGRHWVSAQVVDITGQFPSSRAVEREVEAEGTIIRPLHITSPAPGARVNRSMYVAGVASPGRGNVHVSVGGGPVVEASVWANQQIWGTWVRSGAHGTVPLTVSMPRTGEQITQNVEVAPYSELTADRSVIRYPLPGEPAELRLIAHGNVDINSDDTEVLYLAREPAQGRLSWKRLTDIDEAGYWSYDGPRPVDIEALGEEVDGVRYAEVISFMLPGQKDGYDNRVVAPLLREAPEVTSPLRVGRTTVLEGVDRSGARTLPVEVVLPDGPRLTATPDAQGRWSLPVSDLPLGRTVIEVRKLFNETRVRRFEVATVVLEVVANP